MTRAHKRDVDKGALRESWREQAAALGFSADKVSEAARERRAMEADASERIVAAGGERHATGDREAEKARSGEMERDPDPSLQAVAWATAHLSEREAVFARTDLLAAALAWKPGAVSVEDAGKAIDTLQKDGRLHAAPRFLGGDGMTTDTALGDERETIGLMRHGRDKGEVRVRQSGPP